MQKKKQDTNLGSLRCLGVIANLVGCTKSCEVVTTIYLESESGSVLTRQKLSSHIMFD